MTFLEASWLGGICATAYPADCSWCHTPLAFDKTPSLSPCGPSTLQLLCTQEAVLGSIQCNPHITALAQIYTMQVWKAKERKVYTEQTQQLRLCHGVEEIKENHTKGERRVFNSFRPSFYQVILFLPIWMTHLSPTVHSNPGRKEEITSNNCVRVWKM